MALLQWPRRFKSLVASLTWVLCATTVQSYELDVDSKESITKVAGQMAADMLSFYDGDRPGGTPGLLPQPYYWWEAGAMMGSLVDYWYYTKDSKYNELVIEGLQFQIGENNDFMPRNQTLTEGNDDQGFWAFAVMSAAEYNFPNPPEGKPGWLALAQAVFNTQVARWETSYCAGGLRWQIFEWNNGYDYKNSISQGCFFALAARLALYTGNTTYADWAVKTWDWMVDIKLINTETWGIYDGVHIGDNCTEITPWQFTYNAGTFILGAAAMYNMTESKQWKTRLDNLLEGAGIFFTGPDKNIMTEVACESVGRCNLDEQSFKAYLSRWLAAITKWAPYTYETVNPLLRASAKAAAAQCTGGQNGRLCGLKWNENGTWDGTFGVGQQMAAMEVTLACMVKDRGRAYTSHTGGTSKGDVNAGGSDIGKVTPIVYRTLNTGDRVGAAILTALFVGVFVGGIFWIFLDETSDKTPIQQMSKFKNVVATSMAQGGAAGVLRKRGHDSFTTGINEKSGGLVTESVMVGGISSGDSTSSTSGEPITRPMSVMQVRTAGVSRHARRSSNMPIGWPYNPSMRTSLSYEPGTALGDPDRPWSGHRMRTSGSLTHSSSEPSSPRMPQEEIIEEEQQARRRSRAQDSDADETVSSESSSEAGPDSHSGDEHHDATHDA